MRVCFLLLIQIKISTPLHLINYKHQHIFMGCSASNTATRNGGTETGQQENILPSPPPLGRCEKHTKYCLVYIMPFPRRIQFFKINTNVIWSCSFVIHFCSGWDGGRQEFEVAAGKFYCLADRLCWWNALIKTVECVRKVFPDANIKHVETVMSVYLYTGCSLPHVERTTFMSGRLPDECFNISHGWQK